MALLFVAQSRGLENPGLHRHRVLVDVKIPVLEGVVLELEVLHASSECGHLVNWSHRGD